jgi:hypothetical protein
MAVCGTNSPNDSASLPQSPAQHGDSLMALCQAKLAIVSDLPISLGVQIGAVAGGLAEAYTVMY